MASRGDKVARKVNEAINVKFGLSDNGVFATGKTVTATVYDETDTSFSTPTVTESPASSGLYEFSFTPDTAGQWSAKIVETTIPAAAAWAWDVETTVVTDTVDTINSDTDNIQTRLPAALVSGRMDSSVGAVASGAITNLAFSAGAIDAAAIAANAIGSSELADGAIASTKFAAGAINAAAIADGAIDALTFETGAITAAAIAADAIGASEIADGALTEAKFDTDAISARVIALDAIGSSELAASAVTEIQSGLATAAALSTAQADLDNIQLRLPSPLTTGTADSGTNLTMVDAALAQADNDYWKGCWIRFTSGTISGQTRYISAFTASSNTIIFTPATTQAVGTNTYEILPAAGVLAADINSTVLASIQAQIIDDASPFHGLDIDAAISTRATPAQVNTEVDTALADVRLDELAAVTAGGVPPAASSLLQLIQGATFTSSTDSLEALRNKETDIETDTQDIQTTIGVAGAGLTAIPWNATWDAEVESEVNDALNTAISELTQAIPSATPTIRQALMLLYMALRNRLDVSTSGTPDVLEVHNDAGVVIAKKQITDDGNDYSEQQMEAGP